ncbi:hypothetical protein E3N88_09679 [Mikania micrantha]|uniref:Uncharacterized protein n=1 Tax=Mikania micrantha TaxID=192012 RepID=A0A5N6PM15_9ASTR|nr:hypothetical protein E3N88_09679 [Mikania micrantha]
MTGRLPSKIDEEFGSSRMKRLAKRWKNVHSDEDDEIDGKFSLPTSSDFQPMDTAEQEELVKSLERSQAQQSRFWRRVFAGMLFCFVAFLIFSIHGQTTMPWELRYHAYFMDEIESWIVIAADLLTRTAIHEYDQIIGQQFWYVQWQLLACFITHDLVDDIFGSLAALVFF